jgi:transposase-like protein
MPIKYVEKCPPGHSLSDIKTDLTCYTNRDLLHWWRNPTNYARFITDEENLAMKTTQEEIKNKELEEDLINVNKSREILRKAAEV